MIAKLKIVEEECDESVYWLELLLELAVINPARADPLMDEATQILRMTVKSITTLRKKLE